MIAKSTLDPITLKYLEELLGKNPEDLIPDEIAFLNSRSAYLTKTELELLPKIVEEKPIIKEEPKKEVLKWKPKVLK